MKMKTQSLREEVKQEAESVGYDFVIIVDDDRW